VLIIPLREQQKSDYPKSWTYYTEQSLRKLHEEGRLFSWHLYLESQCIYTPRTKPLLAELGEPSVYIDAVKDIEELGELLNESIDQLTKGSQNEIYEIGIIHTCIRDIAMSASWHLLESPCFSVNAPYCIPFQAPLPKEVYQSTISARHASTRGTDLDIDVSGTIRLLIDSHLPAWASKIKEYVHEYIS
jgi:hypothetical protein